MSAVMQLLFTEHGKCWNKILDNATLKEEDFIASYVLDKNPLSLSVLDRTNKHFKNYKNFNMVDGIRGEHTSFEDWIYTVKNCKFFSMDNWYLTDMWRE